jgi:hypothetical protein
MTLDILFNCRLQKDLHIGEDGCLYFFEAQHGFGGSII